MRSDRPCGRPAPCRFTVVSGGRGQRLPAWQARCNPRRTPAAAPGDRATAATELRKLSHAALGARPDSPFPIRWAGRHRRAWDLVGTERWIASCLGACRHRRVRRGRRATDLRFGGGTERPLLAVRHRAASNCSRSTAATGRGPSWFGGTLGTELQPVTVNPIGNGVIPARPELSPGRGGDHPHIGMICVWQTARATCSLAAPSFCLAVRVTGGSANVVVSRPPSAPPKVSSAGWVGAAATVSDRSPSAVRCADGGRSTPTITNDGCRFNLMERSLTPLAVRLLLKPRSQPGDTRSAACTAGTGRTSGISDQNFPRTTGTPPPENFRE